MYLEFLFWLLANGFHRRRYPTFYHLTYTKAKTPHKLIPLNFLSSLLILSRGALNLTEKKQHEEKN